VLRHENAVLRRHVSRVWYDPAVTFSSFAASRSSDTAWHWRRRPFSYQTARHRSPGSRAGYTVTPESVAFALFLRFLQVRGLVDALRSGGQGRGRTADLPLFRRLCRSRPVHYRRSDRADRRVGPVWDPQSTPVATAVVSTALARSTSDKGGVAPGQSRARYREPSEGWAVWDLRRGRSVCTRPQAAHIGDPNGRLVYFESHWLAEEPSGRCGGVPRLWVDLHVRHHIPALTPLIVRYQPGLQARNKTGLVRGRQ
jgi:hypothetical protein